MPSWDKQSCGVESTLKEWLSQKKKKERKKREKKITLETLTKRARNGDWNQTFREDSSVKRRVGGGGRRGRGRGGGGGGGGGGGRGRGRGEALGDQSIGSIQRMGQCKLFGRCQKQKQKAALNFMPISISYRLFNCCTFKSSQTKLPSPVAMSSEAADYLQPHW